ncbi:hypothetical protein CIHG_00168 [Coccidioides immitis H538.4]|uniref:Uncharacterized protein n=3 Tax=Coccidioides immitis TaxID=5501 RepID=A0A0J8TF54_COCIT|nr:hypothetical protein CIRG_06987 [Coccidioides immitis RMSCC 2394]KMU72242.1 hypothetical protein CISG_00551 [Coccidioides immitis RMSCC 3703]KMU82385.1 hypothetical protein CIHG_00168 [Coccidioides immitis H538.4]
MTPESPCHEPMSGAPLSSGQRSAPNILVTNQVFFSLAYTLIFAGLACSEQLSSALCLLL